MTIFLILAPYGAFALLMLVTSAAVSLFAAAAICLAVIAFDAVRGRSIKILSAGSVITFTAVGAYVILVDPALSISGRQVRGRYRYLAGHPAVDRCPRVPSRCNMRCEVVDAETAVLPGFIRANYIITWAWAGAMLLMMLGNVAMIYVPGLPLWSSLLIAFAARNSAVYFTKWYPEYRKAKYGAPPANALPGTH